MEFYTLSNFSKTEIWIRLIVNFILDGAFEYDVAILILLILYDFVLFSGTVLIFYLCIVNNLTVHSVILIVYTVYYYK